MFRGKYSFLSNFSPAVVYGYPTVEHAYQAAKTTNKAERTGIRQARTPALAKKMGRQLDIREGWDEMKLEVMETLLRKKFAIPMLHKALAETGDMHLCEINYWHDNFWGDCGCQKCQNIEGQNHLGKLLMKIRSDYPEDGIFDLLSSKSRNNWSYNSPEFVNRCKEVIAQERRR